MIEQAYTVKPSKMKGFKPVPANKYQVQISDVNLVKQMNYQKTEEVDTLNFEFLILTDESFDYVDDEGNKQIESTKGRKLWKRVSPILSPAGKTSKASWLFKLLCAVERKELQESDITDISPNSLVGQQLVVMVEETTTGYNNILAFLPAKEELEAIEVVPSTIFTSEELEKIDETLKG